VKVPRDSGPLLGTCIEALLELSVKAPAHLAKSDQEKNDKQRRCNGRA
jgi:hypothetical protein